MSRVFSTRVCFAIQYTPEVDTHLECRDALLGNCNSFPKIGTSKECDLEGILVVAMVHVSSVSDCTLSSNVSVARTLSALECVIVGIPCSNATDR